MKNGWKRLTALMLVMAMCLSLLSANVWAAESSGDGSGSAQSVEAVSAGEEAVVEAEKLTPVESATEEAEPVPAVESAPEEAEEKPNPVEDEKDSDTARKQKASPKGKRKDAELETQEIVASGECGAQGDNLTWTLDDEGTLTISGTGEMKNNSDRTWSWFSGKDSVNKVIISEGVTSIGAYAFSDSNNLTSVSIPASVNRIGTGAFVGCSNLEEMTISPDNTCYLSEDGVLFDNEKTTILFCPRTRTEDFVIPNGITTIGDSAFASCTRLTSVMIPDGVTSIGDYAFASCIILTGVTIPDSVISIGKYSFQWCTGMTGVTIPDSVTSIGESAFDSCHGLSDITIPDSVTSIGSWAFTNCRSLKSVIIPESITKINEALFHSCDSLTEITIPESVISIDDYAFCWCKQLKNITIPDSVTTIGKQAFYNCWSLESISIPNSVTRIGSEAFYKSGLKSGVIPGSVETMGDNIFAYCGSLTNATICDGVTEIAPSMFEECEKLTNVSIPDSVTSIGDRAFYSCYKLNNILIPDRVNNIGDSAFYYCTSLDSIILPNGLKSIGICAFGNCVSLINIVIPDSVITIGGAVCYSCTSLTSATISNNIASIPKELFLGCYSLTEFIIPDGITRIEERAFESSGLTTITIPDGVKTIERRAFLGCNNLTSITFADSVTEIYDHVFEGCTSLSSVELPDHLSYVGWNTFLGCTSLTNVTIPNSVTYIGDNAFQYCSSLRDVFIPDSVVQLYDNAFANCTSLTDISIPCAWVGNNAFNGCTSLTNVTVGKNTNHIGDNAFCDCYSLSTIAFSGDSPAFGNDVYYGVAAKAYYPLNNPTWTDEIRQNYGGSITWLNYGASGSAFAPVFPEQINKNCRITSDLKKDKDGNPQDIESSFCYADIWLVYDDPVFRYELMKTSIRVAQAAFGQNGSGNIEYMMEQMGYKYTESSINYETPNYNTIGSAIGMKNIKKEDGSYRSLILVVIRGGGYGSEWGGNFNVGNDSKYHAGFQKAANTVHGRLNDFISENQKDINDPIVWITGFSRAAATSNLLASYLIDQKTVNGFKIESIQPENVLAYCFECPRNVVDSNAANAKYNGIINVVNPIDFVPKLAFHQWGFTRYGRTYYIPSKETTPNYESEYKIPMLWKYLDLCEQNKITLTEDYVVELNGQASNLDSLLDEVSNKITRNRFKSYVQESMIEIAANALGNAGGNVNWFHAALSMIAAINLPADGGDTLSTAVQLALGKLSVVKKLQFAEKVATLSIHAPSVLKMFKDSGSGTGPGPSAHYPELCMSWIDSLPGFSSYNTSENSWYRRHIINCPVDVTVRDHTGKVVGQAIDHQIQEIEDGVTAFVDENDQIVFVLPMSEEYTVDVQATDNGSVDYMIQEVNGADGTLENVISYQDISVAEGDEIEVQSDDGETEIEERYVLKKENTTLEPAPVLTQETIERCTVSAEADGKGATFGGGYSVKGEYVKLVATSGENAEFLGWYEGGNLVSQEAEYRFCVERDTILTAKFTILPTPGDLTGDGEFTMADVVLLNRYVLGKADLTDEQKVLADVNKDGDITMADVILLNRYVVGLILTLS